MERLIWKKKGVGVLSNKAQRMFPIICLGISRKALASLMSAGRSRFLARLIKRQSSEQFSIVCVYIPNIFTQHSTSTNNIPYSVFWSFPFAHTHSRKGIIKKLAVGTKFPARIIVDKNANLIFNHTNFNLHDGSKFVLLLASA